MEDTATPVMDVDTPSPDVTSTFSNPIESFFGGIFFIIILVLILVFMVILMINKGFSWLGSFLPSPPPVKKEGFDTGPQPCPEHDERCAHFPQV